jgi:hypothetical protein
MGDCSIGDRLLALKRDMGWRGLHLDRFFHATEDPQVVRDEVFTLLKQGQFRVDATILEKSKAQLHLRSERALYKMAWYLHFKYVAPRVAQTTDRMMVTAASLGTRRTRGAFHTAVDDVVTQVSPCASHRVAFWPMASDPLPAGGGLLHVGDPALMGA